MQRISRDPLDLVAAAIGRGLCGTGLQRGKPIDDWSD
jgi:hypothetical protein